ncbi:malate dehydrogenase [Lobosporangium transversale]|uniref:Malate dehydrogenase n=1 Tax=Lobosporangium transversale TaxID=64571 RepID=A0A1Y2GMR5_9FUNG|nr:malate dehydrogenase [Lobosporangium transversale]ORZ15577.1 malate dehydrogenase [Lobosporangium transversale]|eukprot:XP_021881325.1 malate dehydrogenase [Lobosporangium transversale]
MVKVVVCGAAGGIGQPLSLLLKQSDLISHLALYDIVNAIGVAADLSHINTASKVTGHVGAGALAEALQGAHTVVIPAGVPRRPGMTRDDLFKVNASIVRDLAQACAEHCPKAFILVISNPVNSTVPIVCEVLKKANVFDPRRVFGVTTLDVVRSSRFVHEVKPQFEPHEIANRITVVGGHSGATIVPILSKINQQPHNQSISFTPEEIKTLTHRIQFGGDEVVKAKDGAGSATLSMAYAGARFTLSLLEASVRGKRGVVESTFVHLPGNPGSEWNQRFTGLDYFAQDVELGPDGVAKVLALPELSTEEQALVKIAINELKGNVTKGVKFITEPQPGAPPAAKL